MKSIHDLCDQVFEGSTPATPNEVVRLAAFIKDHPDHKAFGQPTVEKLGLSQAPAGTGLMARLTPPDGAGTQTPAANYGAGGVALSADDEHHDA